MSTIDAALIGEPAPAKLNLALHVRGRRSDGRHEIETIFVFCVDGDRVEARPDETISVAIDGPFSGALGRGEDNLVLGAARALAAAANVNSGADLRLIKRLPIASGIGGGSADAAATLRLLTRLWGIDPGIAQQVAPSLGSDVPACLLSMTSRGSGAGDHLVLEDAGVAGVLVLLVNPRVPLSTGHVFAAWDGVDRGPLGDWREGRNDLERPACNLVPEIQVVLDFLGRQSGVRFARMSGSGATCFALFDQEAERDAVAELVPHSWWHLATRIR